MPRESVAITTLSLTTSVLDVGEHILVLPSPELESIRKAGVGMRGMMSLVESTMKQDGRASKKVQSFPDILSRVFWLVTDVSQFF